MFFVSCSRSEQFNPAACRSILIRYSFALKRFQGQKKKISIEGIIRKGNDVAEKFLEMESLNEADYALLGNKMKGFIINREEVVYIEPDVKFFLDLSQKYGTPSDVAFF